jgi:hypothetical protein
MNNSHDDFPHPVPPIAYVRWKENYFFVVMDETANVFGVAHFNCEPGFDRVRISVNLKVAGNLVTYANEIRFPKVFEMSPTIGDEHVRMHIDKSHEQFRLEGQTADFSLKLTFRRRMPSFDFGVCQFAAPDIPSFREVATVGYNLPFEHLQQAMFVSGTVTAGASPTRVLADGLGYRDHTWCMRSDNIVSTHSWCGLNFDGRVFGVMSLATLARPGLVAKEGYVADADGTRALRAIDIDFVKDHASGENQTMIHRIRDVSGNQYTIESNLTEPLSQVVLLSEKPNSNVTYTCVETFTRSILRETGERGTSLVELGHNSEGHGWK